MTSKRPILFLLAALIACGGAGGVMLSLGERPVAVRLGVAERAPRLIQFVSASGELKPTAKATLARDPQAPALEAVITIGETDLTRVKVGQRAELRFAALLGAKPVPGRVREIGAAALPLPEGPVKAGHGKEFRVVIAPEGLPPEIKVGMTCGAEINTGERENVLVAPLSALLAPRPTGGPQGMFVPGKDGRVRFRPVRTGAQFDATVEVLEGLSEGELVVAGPRETLRSLTEGARVREMAEGEPSGDADNE